MSINYLNKTFIDKPSFALYLKENYDEAIANLVNHNLYKTLEDFDIDFFNQFCDYIKTYEVLDNILALLIFLLDNKLLLVTKDKVYNNPLEIASKMKEVYPKKDERINDLFRDSIMYDIYKALYNDTKDNYYKRYYLFFKKIYDNKSYSFIYYYFLFLHLDKNEAIRFNFDNIKMHNIEGLSKHLIEASNRLFYLLDLIKESDVILALLAKQTSLESVVKALEDDPVYLLKPLSLDGTISFKMTIEKEFVYWLIDNYDNYLYENSEAIKLKDRYQKLQIEKNKYFQDYLDNYLEALALYKIFISNYENNEYVHYKKGIKAKSDEYSLLYKKNNCYVCKKYLIDNDIFDNELYSLKHASNVAKEMVINDINLELEELSYYQEHVREIREEKVKNRREILGIMFSIILLISSILLGYFVNKYLYLSLVLGFLFLLINAYLLNKKRLINKMISCYDDRRDKYFNIINHFQLEDEINTTFMKELNNRRKQNKKHYHKVLKYLKGVETDEDLSD